MTTFCSASNLLIFNICKYHFKREALATGGGVRVDGEKWMYKDIGCRFMTQCSVLDKVKKVVLTDILLYNNYFMQAVVV